MTNFKDPTKSILVPSNSTVSFLLILSMATMLPNTQSWLGQMFSKPKNSCPGINVNNCSKEPSSICRTHTKFGTCSWKSTLIFALPDPFIPKSMKVSTICSREHYKNFQKCHVFGSCTQRCWKTSIKYPKRGLFSTGHLEICLWPNTRKSGKSFLFGPWS